MLMTTKLSYFFPLINCLVCVGIFDVIVILRMILTQNAITITLILM